MEISCTRGDAYEYHVDGIDLFSVSQVRKMAHDTYAGISEDVLEPARRRGALLHARFWRVLAAQDHLIDMPKPIVGLEGYCLSMDRWVAQNQVLPVKLEETSWCEKLGYAGTPDALVLIGPKPIPTIIDLKTGAPTKTDPMQLLAYQKMTGYEGAKELLDLYIQEDGSDAKPVKVTPRMKATEWSWFLSALNLLKARRNHGVK